MLAFGAARSARAEVFLAKREALAAAFPGADRIEKRRFFLTKEQVERVRRLSGAELESALVTVHVGHRGAKTLGYAFLVTHPVRTSPETLLVVVTPEGGVGDVLLLAFYEPPEYRPRRRWLEQFRGQALDRHLRVGRRIHGIAGATLTSRAATRGVRQALALYAVLIRDRRDP